MKQSTGFSAVAELALIVAAAMLVPTAIGYAADLRFGTTPWALLAGVLVGIVIATVGLSRNITKRYERLAPPPDE